MGENSSHCKQIWKKALNPLTYCSYEYWKRELSPSTNGSLKDWNKLFGSLLKGEIDLKNPSLKGCFMLLCFWAACGFTGGGVAIGMSSILHKNMVEKAQNHGPEVSAEQKERIDQAFEDLKTIPFMQPIMQNLPKDIRYVVDTNETRSGFYSRALNTIGIDEELLNYTTPEEKLSLYVILAHELCHANQYKEGLSGEDLITPSFGQAFRVFRMNEVEAKLLDTVVEHELLKRQEFCECTPSKFCQYFQKKLYRAKGDVANAKTAFVLTLWNNDLSELHEGEKKCVNHYNEYYIEYAHTRAISKCNEKIKFLLGRRMPKKAMHMMVQRMGLMGVTSDQFLQSGFVQTPEACKNRTYTSVWQNSQGR